MNLRGKSMKKIKILSNISWTFSGNIIYALTQFMLLSVIAKIGGPAEVGIFTLSLAIVSPVFLLLNLRLRTVIVTDSNDDYSFWDYENLRKFTSVIAILIILGIVMISDYTFYIYTTILMVSVAKLFEMKIDLYYGFFQKKVLFDVIAKSVIMRGILNLLVVTTIYFFSENLMWSMLGMAITNYTIYSFYDKKHIKKYINIKKSSKKVNFVKIKMLFLLALPLGLSTLIGSLNTNVPRYIIENKLGLYELGIFSGLAYLLVIGNTLLNAVSQVFMPKLSQLSKKNDYDNFESLLKKMIFSGMIMSLLMIIFFSFAGELVLTIIYSKEYLEYTQVLMILVIGVSVLYSSVFLGTAITVLKEFKIQPYIHFTSLIFLTFASLILIENYRLVGMAWALVIGYFVTSLGYFFILKNILKRRRSINDTNM
ncbi:hypothetical protein BLL40_05000 [Domibacillus mangrovi]|uniref:Polysaccharide biosynthesis protein C-terminal domain-containing protein n=2 Tax=Domibacillus mangrovi TaxID=1714354 RepID=A0A1Q5P5W5_9BACI|nr:hypothetical protein BLL40_05000 [Domibacillus mangrovi]